MSKPIITVDNVSKKYLIYHQGSQYKSLRDILGYGVQHPVKSAKRLLHPEGRGRGREEFWALRDVSFSVEEGQVVGIIGKNGAGKSTLLKILTRVTYPTKGSARLRGRVASLLEVGTGFHPELTGRENVYLNAAILGMRKREIDRQFDSIVDFSGVERFLDTPVKRYSSGMYVRLAFAVAAHIHSDILLVDEVLAVGDAAFQKKCIAKMKEVASQRGRTILFISHNMDAVQTLCSHGILLEDGSVAVEGKIQEVIDQYLQKRFAAAKTPLEDVKRKGNGAISLTNIYLTDKNGDIQARVSAGQDVSIVLEYKKTIDGPLDDISAAIGIDNNRGVRLSHMHTQAVGTKLSITKQTGKIICHIPKMPLVPGQYIITTLLRANQVIADTIDEAHTFEVQPGDYYQSGWVDFHNQGNVFVDHEWLVD